ncbi:rCG52994 [Rattus norvegicus]|uniref:RCG52994 n=1 Tax=Rattus norvegicus TaxID=10116 RepID=A6IQX2_RAT|nr:rCG52994 [Rattus norvegicus]
MMKQSEKHSHVQSSSENWALPSQQENYLVTIRKTHWVFSYIAPLYNHSGFSQSRQLSGC